MPRILIIEDELPIRRGVADALRVSGYRPIEAGDGASGLALALTEELDLVLLDLLLPGRDGMQVLAEIRTARSSLPVIILTARGGESDRVAGLRAGADDYVVKPFSARELLARIQAVLRRTAGPSPAVRSARLGRVQVDFERREIRGNPVENGRRLELSASEWSILNYLVANRHRTVSRDELMNRLWGIPAGAETRTIDMHVARLRQKLCDAVGPSGGNAIVTVRGQGYMASRDLKVDCNK
jgi:DNA-binding response OmpR family regulator